MPMHAEKRWVPYTPSQMNNLVFDVEHYPAFLPWCQDAIIYEKSETHLRAELVVGYKIFRERFTSHVTRIHPHRVDVTYENGPFKYLNNHWIFETTEGKEGCVIDFFIDFELHTRLFQNAMQLVFNEAVKVMIRSFERRAASLYEKKSL